MNAQQIFVGLIGVMIVIAGWVVYDARSSEAALRSEVQTYADVQLQAVLEAADALRQTNSSDEAFAGVVTDCAPDDRVRLDELLGQLSELAQTQLIELDGLYRECGAFFAQQRSLKAYVLTLRSEQLQIYYDTLHELAQSTATDRQDLVSQLVSLEVASAQLSQQLVDIQGEIIDALLAGATADSDEVLRLLKTAQEARENLQFNTQEAKALRSELSS